MESQCDFVLCEGTDYTGVASAFEFDFNADVANNLGCPVLGVVNGRGKTPQEISEEVRFARESFESHGCIILSMIVNRIAPLNLSALSEQFKREAAAGESVYFLPEEPLLGKPTVDDIATTLKCHILQGDPDRLNREVLDIKIAAMNLPHFLDHILDGTLVITPGDRSDIIIDPLKSDLITAYSEIYYELRRHKGISAEMARDTMTDVSYFGTMMVHMGAANGMVSGTIHTTGDTIRPALQIIRTRPGCSIVSSVFLMCLADRVVVYGDCAVNPDPNAEQLADIAISSAETAQIYGIEPRVAMCSYSTGESGKGADVDKVRAATWLARDRRPELKIEGPIQYDAAVDAGVARTKLPDSEVAGRATVFIFPDLNTGNNLYKAVQRSANAAAIGPILQGLNKPVNDLSRGATISDIINTVAITAIQAQAVGTDDRGQKKEISFSGPITQR